MLTSQTAPAPKPGEALTQIRQDSQAYIDAVKSGNPEQVAACFEDGAVLVPLGRRPCVSTEDITQYCAQLFNEAEVVDIRTPYETLEAGDALAYQAATYEFEIQPRGGGPPVTAPYKGIAVWRKQEDGRWKVSREIWNDSTPAEPPKQQLLMELQKLIDANRRCLKAGDLDAAGLVYAEDVVLMAPEQPALIGWPAAREWIGAWLAAWQVDDASIRIYNPVSYGALIYCRCRFSFDLQRRADGSRARMVGDGAMVVRREADGDLRVIWDLWPAARPLEPSPEARELADLIEQRSRQYERDVMAANVEGWAAYFDENAVVMPNNAPIQTSRASLLEFGRGYLNAFAVGEMRLETVELDLGGDWALRRLEYQNRMTAKLTGEKYLVKGNALEIWRQRGDSWTVIHSVWTVDPPDGVEQMPSSGPSHAEFGEIARTRVAAQSEVFLKNDVELWAAYFTPQARLAADLLGPAHGRRAIAALVGSNYFERFIYTAARIRVEDALALGGYGVVRLTVHFDLQPKTGGPVVPYTGSCIELWEKQPDGSWLTADCTVTSDKPAA